MSSKSYLPVFLMAALAPMVAKAQDPAPAQAGPNGVLSAFFASASATEDNGSSSGDSFSGLGVSYLNLKSKLVLDLAWREYKGIGFNTYQAGYYFGNGIRVTGGIAQFTASSASTSDPTAGVEWRYHDPGFGLVVGLGKIFGDGDGTTYFQFGVGWNFGIGTASPARDHVPANTVASTASAKKRNPSFVGPTR